MGIKLSVITVTYNSEETIDKYIKSLFSCLPEFSEILIVDNNSQDKTVEKLLLYLKNHAQIRLIQESMNLGFGKASNKAARQARGDYLLFLNPDTKITKGSIGELLDFYDQHADAGIVAPKLLEDNQIQPSVRKLPTLLGAVREYYLNQKGNYEAYAPKEEQPVSVESVVGAAMLIKKSIFEKVKGFDERFFMYYEDLALCREILSKGLKIYFLPNVIFYHKVGASFSEKKGQWIQKSAQVYHGFIGWLLLYIVLRLRPRKK